MERIFFRLCSSCYFWGGCFWNLFGHFSSFIHHSYHFLCPFALTQKDQKVKANPNAPLGLPGQRTTVIHYRWRDALGQRTLLKLIRGLLVDSFDSYHNCLLIEIAIGAAFLQRIIQVLMVEITQKR